MLTHVVSLIVVAIRQNKISHIKLTEVVFSVLLLCLFAGRAWADILPGVDWYVRDAQIIALVRGASTTNAADGSQDVTVQSVLKGIWLESKTTVSGVKLTTGQTAILLLPYAPIHYAPALSGSTRSGRSMTWPLMTDGTLSTAGIPVQSTSKQIGRGMANEPKADVNTVRAYIAQFSPEEVDLSDQVRDTVLFPDSLERLRSSNPKRARYVAMMTAILDIDRDVSSFAGLLESPDVSVRQSANRHLMSLYPSADIRPNGDDELSFRQKSAAWRESWKTNRDRLIWNDAHRAWEYSKEAKSTRNWPPIPESQKIPSNTAQATVIDALGRFDERAFGTAFRNWLDSGAVRDRSILEACNFGGKAVSEGNLEGACGMDALAPPAPRLREEILVGGDLPARDRFYVIARYVSVLLHEHFAEERESARRVLAASDPCSEVVRRAVFWEPTDTNLQTPGAVAFGRLALCPNAEASSSIAAHFLQTKSRDGFMDIVNRLEHGDPTLANILLEALKSDCDDPAVWAARALAVASDSRVVPGLLRFLGSDDPLCRARAAWNLSEIPRPESVMTLQKVIGVETDANARDSEVVALAEIGSPESLDILLAAASQSLGEWARICVVRGLARVRNPKALMTLATVALSAKDNSQLAWESVNAFGYISGLYKGFPPHSVRSGGAINPQLLQDGLRAIAGWMKANPHQ